MISSHLTQLEHDILTEVATIGANHAISPVSKMIGTKINVQVPTLQLVALEAVPGLMGEAEQIMTAVVVKIEGEVGGTILFLMHPADATNLVHGLAPGQEGAALEEVGNILAGSALGALGHFLGITFMQSVPGSATDMVRAMINEITGELGAQADSILALGIHFETETTHLGGQLYFLFDPSSSQKILAAARLKMGAANGS